MLTRNQKYVFTLSFNFIDLPGVVRSISHLFPIDPELPMPDQISDISKDILVKYGVWYNKFIQTSFGDHDKLDKNGFNDLHCEIVSTDEFKMSIDLANNYTTISFNECIMPKFCYTFYLQTNSKSVLYDFLDIFLHSGNRIDYSINVATVDIVKEDVNE